MKAHQLDTIIREIRQQWGQQALQPLSTLALPGAIPTGFPALDDALGIGGIPRGRITEMIGMPTSGMLTLAYHTIAQAQTMSDTAVYIDLGRNLDADYARHCGVQTDLLWLVRPASLLEALTIARELVRSNGVGVIALEFPPTWALTVLEDERLPHLWQQLQASLVKSSCALLFLVASHGVLPPLTYTAALRLLIEYQEWIGNRG